jgi:hypothetical protein
MPLVRAQVIEPSLGARARDAVRALLYSFVLTSLKARLCRADLFPRLEGLQLFRDELGLPQPPPLDEPGPQQQPPLDEPLRVVRAAGRARLGLWLCDWGGCTNMEGPSELKLVAMLCPGRCERRQPAAECGRRYCSPACRAAAVCHTTPV